MHLLYVDDSGHPDDPVQDWFVFAGVSVFERQSFWFSQELDKIASRFDPTDCLSVELHAAEMRNGRNWRQHKPVDRIQAICDSLDVLAKSNYSNRIFAVAVKKGAIVDQDPVEYAFTQLSSRFDQYLRRLHLQGNTQRGLMIFDKKEGERRIQGLGREFRTQGHQWGTLTNFAEVPVFMDSKASRLLQLADLVAYAIYRKYQNDDSTFFKHIENRFDKSDGILHGLHVRE